MIVKINDTTAIELDIDEREFKMLLMCREYGKDPFGAPNHMLMNLVSKLWNFIGVLEEREDKRFKKAFMEHSDRDGE
jgi:hypothetical protein